VATVALRGGLWEEAQVEPRSEQQPRARSAQRVAPPALRFGENLYFYFLPQMQAPPFADC